MLKSFLKEHFYFNACRYHEISHQLSISYNFSVTAKGQLISKCPYEMIVSSKIQGVRGQSGFFNLALRDRNIQVRLCLKVVLKC